MEDRGEAFVPNPLLGSLFGLGPLVAAAKSFGEGAILGFGAALGGLLLGSLSARTRSLLPERFRTPFALASAGFYSLFYSLAIEALFPLFGAALGFYLPLIAVNSFLLHGLRGGLRRGEAASGGFWLPSLSYTLTALLVSGLRELIGLGSLSLPTPGSQILRLVLFPTPPLRVLATPAGGFILVGLLAAAYRSSLRALGRRIP